MITLITGPVRSGKSTWAESLAQAQPLPVIYVATAHPYPDDPEWQARLIMHQQRRPPHWQTWEVPENVPEAIAQAPIDHFLLLDSLGTWTANLLDRDNTAWEHQVQLFLQTLRGKEMVIVAEETGWGVVPPYASGRLFRDRLGILTRLVAHHSDRAYLMVAGYALDIKQLGHKCAI